MAPPSDRPALASGEACLLHPVSIPSPLLSSISRTKPPRGNRGEARRTFRLITVLQFNEKPVSVLSVHNGRRFARLHRPSLDRASTLRRNETLRGANLRTRIHQTCWLLPSFVIRYPDSDSLAFGDLHGDGTKRLPFGGTYAFRFSLSATRDPQIVPVAYRWIRTFMFWVVVSFFSAERQFRGC